MNKITGAQILVVPSDRVAKQWSNFYWPHLKEGLLVKQADFPMLSGNILSAIGRDIVGVLSFWWFDDQGEGKIVTLALFSITQDQVTGLRCVNIYSIARVREARPHMIRGFLARFKHFMESKKIDRLIADVGNDRWVKILAELEPKIKLHTTVTMEVK